MVYTDKIRNKLQKRFQDLCKEKLQTIFEDIRKVETNGQVYSEKAIL